MGPSFVDRRKIWQSIFLEFRIPSSSGTTGQWSIREKRRRNAERTRVVGKIESGSRTGVASHTTWLTDSALCRGLTYLPNTADRGIYIYAVDQARSYTISAVITYSSRVRVSLRPSAVDRQFTDTGRSIRRPRPRYRSTRGLIRFPDGLTVPRTFSNYREISAVRCLGWRMSEKWTRVNVAAGVIKYGYFIYDEIVWDISFWIASNWRFSFISYIARFWYLNIRQKKIWAMLMIFKINFQKFGANEIVLYVCFKAPPPILTIFKYVIKGIILNRQLKQIIT